MYTHANFEAIGLERQTQEDWIWKSSILYHLSHSLNRKFWNFSFFKRIVWSCCCYFSGIFFFVKKWKMINIKKKTTVVVFSFRAFHDESHRARPSDDIAADGIFYLKKKKIKEEKKNNKEIFHYETSHY